MNSSEPFGSHFINHLFPCVESCPIRMKSFGSLSRADKPVDLLGAEAVGQAAPRGATRSTCSADTSHPLPPSCPSPQTRNNPGRGPLTPKRTLTATHLPVSGSAVCSPPPWARPPSSPPFPCHLKTVPKTWAGPRNTLLSVSQPLGPTLKQYDSLSRFRDFH